MSQLAREWGCSEGYVADARRGLLEGCDALPAAKGRPEGGSKAVWLFDADEAAAWLEGQQGRYAGDGWMAGQPWGTRRGG